MMRWYCWVISFSAVLSFLNYLAADDTHYQDFVIGARAIGLGGAYTALSYDPSGIYYNPAGLSDSRSTNFQISTSLYGFERGSEGFALPIEGLTELDINFTDLIIIPASAGFVSTIGKPDIHGNYRHAYGVLVAVPSFRSSSTSETIEEQGVLTTYTHRVSDRSLWAGAAYSYRATQRLQLGASAFFALRSVVDVEDVSIAVPTASDQYNFNIATNDLSFLSGSVLLGFGLRYVIKDGPFNTWMLGAQLRSPSVRVHSDGTMLITRGYSDPDAEYGNRSSFDRHTITEIQSSSSEGLSVRLGAAFVRYRSFTVAADLSFHNGISYNLLNIDDQEIADSLPFTTQIERKPVVNFNIGAEYLIIKEVSVSAGMYSDFSSAPSIPNDPTKSYLSRVNLIGFTGALGYFGEYTLSRIGFTYAAGVGEGVVPLNETQRLLDEQQSFSKVDKLFQSFFYIFISSSFRY